MQELLDQCSNEVASLFVDKDQLLTELQGMLTNADGEFITTLQRYADQANATLQVAVDYARIHSTFLVAARGPAHARWTTVCLVQAMTQLGDELEDHCQAQVAHVSAVLQQVWLNTVHDPRANMRHVFQRRTRKQSTAASQT